MSRHHHHAVCDAPPKNVWDVELGRYVRVFYGSDCDNPGSSYWENQWRHVHDVEDAMNVAFKYDVKAGIVNHSDRESMILIDSFDNSDQISLVYIVYEYEWNINDLSTLFNDDDGQEESPTTSQAQERHQGEAERAAA